MSSGKFHCWWSKVKADTILSHYNCSPGLEIPIITSWHYRSLSQNGWVTLAWRSLLSLSEKIRIGLDRTLEKITPKLWYKQECIPVGCVPSTAVAVSPASCHAHPCLPPTLQRTPPCHTHPHTCLPDMHAHPDMHLPPTMHTPTREQNHWCLWKHNLQDLVKCPSKLFGKFAGGVTPKAPAFLL